MNNFVFSGNSTIKPTALKLQPSLLRFNIQKHLNYAFSRLYSAIKLCNHELYIYIKLYKRTGKVARFFKPLLFRCYPVIIRYDSDTVCQSNDLVRFDSDTVGDRKYSVRDDKDSVGVDSERVGDRNHSVGDGNNSVGDDDDLVGDDDNFGKIRYFLKMDGRIIGLY